MLVTCLPISSGTLENYSLQSEILRVLERNKQAHCRKRSLGQDSRLLSEECFVVFCCSLLYLCSVSPSFYFKIYLKRVFLSQIEDFFHTEQFVWVCSSFGYSWKTENAILFYTETFRHVEHTKLVWGHGQYLQQQQCSALGVNCKAKEFWCRGPDVRDRQVNGSLTSDQLQSGPFPFLGVEPQGGAPGLHRPVQADPRRTRFVLSSTASQSMLNWDVQFNSTFLIRVETLVQLHPELPWCTPQCRSNGTTSRVQWQVQDILFM